jgi:hypothetical protein
MNKQMDFQVPPQYAKTLTELTDEPRLEVALRLVLKDALEYRFEKVKEGLSQFRDKYGVAFPTFKKQWLTKKIPNRHSYPVERDYWEWEGLTSRLAVLNRLKKWL